MGLDLLAGFLLCPICALDWRGRYGCCAACLQGLFAPLSLPGLTTLGYYRGSLARAVRAYKFGGARCLGSLFGDALAAAVTERDWRPDVVCHVPLHAARRRQRGFDQAQLLARSLATGLGRPHQALLERRRATSQQAHLSAAGRRRNVQAAFRPVAAAHGTVLLVDDVFTTGATLASCAAQLRRAGANQVLLAATALAPAPASRPESRRALGSEADENTAGDA